MTERVEVAIVGGGPAGAVLAAARLARRLTTVVVLERAPAWRWRAGGVFTSPAAVGALRRIGLRRGDAGRRRAADPRDARRDPRRDDVPADLRRRDGGEPAVGFDRSALDPALLALADRAGAEVRRGWTVDGGRARTAAGSEVRRPDGRRDDSTAARRRRRRRPALGRRPRGAASPGRSRLDPRVGLTLPPRRPATRTGLPRCPDARARRRLCRDRARRRAGG